MYGVKTLAVENIHWNEVLYGSKNMSRYASDNYRYHRHSSAESQVPPHVPAPGTKSIPAHATFAISSHPACSTAVVTSFPPTIVVLNISGTACSLNTPSSSPSTGKLMLMLLHLAVVISASRHSFDR